MLPIFLFFHSDMLLCLQWSYELYNYNYKDIPDISIAVTKIEQLRVLVFLQSTYSSSHLVYVLLNLSFRPVVVRRKKIETSQEQSYRALSRNRHFLPIFPLKLFACPFVPLESFQNTYTHTRARGRARTRIYTPLAFYITLWYTSHITQHYHATVFHFFLLP